MKQPITILLCALLWYAQPILAQEDRAPCYQHDTAYLTGVMNIREEPTTQSSIVLRTRAGHVYDVLSTEKGNAWCWLEIEPGWMAVTGYVTEQVTHVGFPQIRGSETEMIPAVEDALDYLRRQSLDWFDYAVKPVRRIVTERPYVVWRWEGGVARVEYDETYVWGFTGERREPLYLSSVLVHEACHHYQWDERRWSKLTDVEREEECYGVQLEYVREVAPNNRQLVQEFQRYMNAPQTT
ncbi:MAG: hypothetical protein OXG39_16405 [Chloroflexi bacterium]|nr:hypothetical protein [Chloroflexota bacterium]